MLFFRGLSADDTPDYEDMLAQVCADISRQGLTAFVPSDSSSIRFGAEKRVGRPAQRRPQTSLAGEMDPR